MSAADAMPRLPLMLHSAPMQWGPTKKKLVPEVSEEPTVWTQRTECQGANG